MEDKKYPIELEAITPLAVGAGNDNDWVKGIDYVQKDGKVYVIDMQKVAAAGIDVEALTALFLKYDETGICQLLGNRIGELSRYVFDSPVRTANNIKTFMRTQFYDKPLVAGSSIKGSVRSALFNYLRTDEEKNEEVFGTMKDGTDFMRFIRIGDIEMYSTLLINTKLFNLRTEGAEWHGGWKHGMNNTTGRYKPDGFNTLYECVSPGQKGIGNISLAAAAFSLLDTYGQGKSPYASKKRALLNEPISSLFSIINEVTKAYLSKERAFFEKYPVERSGELIDCIDRLLGMMPADGTSCLLKMSAGVGFHSITGDWQFDDYDETGQWSDFRNAGKKKYKSRKIAEYNHRLQLMGFVRLRALSKEEAAEREQTLQKQHHEQQNQMLDAVRCREAEQQQKMAAEQARKQAAEQERQKTGEYNRLILQAKQDKDSERWDEAIANLEKATQLYPEKAEATQLKADIQEAKKIVDIKREMKIADQQRLRQPLADLIQRITKTNNLVNKTREWIEVEGHVFGEQEKVAFLERAKQLPNKEKKKLSTKIAELACLMEKELVDAINNELETI